MKPNIRRFLLLISIAGYCVGFSSIVTYAQARRSSSKPVVGVVRSAPAVAFGRQPDGQGQSAGQFQDELSKLVDECLRFLDATLARGISEAKMREDLWSDGWGLGGHQNAKDLRQHVQVSKESITRAAAAARRDGRPIPSEWNRTLVECIEAYVKAIQELNGIESEMASGLIIPAGALGLTPQRLRAIVATAESGDTRWFVVQDEKSKFDRAHEPHRRQLEERLDACSRAGDYWACATPAYNAYRSGVEPPLQAFMNNVMANATQAESGIAPTAAKYASRWVPVLKDGQNYINRAVVAMKPVSSAELNLPADSPAEEEQQIADALMLMTPEKYGGQAEQTFNFYMNLLYEDVRGQISIAQAHLGDAKATGPATVFQAQPKWKGQNGEEQKVNLPAPREIDVDTKWDELRSALSDLKKISILTKPPKGGQDANPGTTITVRKPN